jgi:hypothetical protein
VNQPTVDELVECLSAYSADHRVVELPHPGYQLDEGDFVSARLERGILVDSVRRFTDFGPIGLDEVGQYYLDLVRDLISFWGGLRPVERGPVDWSCVDEILSVECKDGAALHTVWLDILADCWRAVSARLAGPVERPIPMVPDEEIAAHVAQGTSALAPAVAAETVVPVLVAAPLSAGAHRGQPEYTTGRNMPNCKPIENPTCIAAFQHFVDDSVNFLAEGQSQLSHKPGSLADLRMLWSIIKAHLDTLTDTLGSLDPTVPMFQDFREPWAIVREVVEQLRRIIWKHDDNDAAAELRPEIDYQALGRALDRFAFAVNRVFVCAPSIPSRSLRIDSFALAGKMTLDVPPQASEPQSPPKAKRRKHTPKGGAQENLAGALRSLTSKGKWGETPTELIKLADISRSRFYELTGKDGPLHSAMKRYEDDSRRDAPAHDDDW